MSGMPPPLPTVQPPMMPESVRLVIDKVQQKTGVFSKQTYFMLVTDSRLIFALMTKNAVDYMRQDPNLTLTETQGNFAIPLTELQRIEVYHGDFESNSPDTMVIKTLSGKWTYMIPDAFRVGKNLKSVLGDKVK